MSKLAFLVMPLWQGSPSSRAMQLIDGAEAIREDLPTAARYEVAVPLEAGDSLGTSVARLSTVMQARDSARQLLSELHDDRVSVTVGGDCTSVLAGLERAIALHGAENLTVLWFDAHADLQHPSTSPTGDAASMTLRHVLGDGAEDLRFSSPMSGEAITLLGARSMDAEEIEEVDQRNISQIDHTDTEATEFAELVRATLRSRKSTHVYIHVDLDVLDPAEFTSVSSAVPFGLSMAQLTLAIRAALDTVPLAGAAVCGFQPPTPHAASEHLPSVLRVLGALASRGNK